MVNIDTKRIYKSNYASKYYHAVQLIERVFTEILYPSSLPANMSLWDKTCKFFASNWKFKLVYSHENILMASLRQARAYRRVKWNKEGVSIWEKTNNSKLEC